jgi:hypothetical protein
MPYMSDVEKIENSVTVHNLAAAVFQAAKNTG